ncbi:hypothetical protein GGR58DRAFT_379240 [Xylaria digitata]|nr:hypothetical protein GGR58DRAFT_379240 [Xylaria digitata]
MCSAMCSCWVLVKVACVCPVCMYVCICMYVRRYWRGHMGDAEPTRYQLPTKKRWCKRKLVTGCTAQQWRNRQTGSINQGKMMESRLFLLLPGDDF